jgi:hypothetical protein
MPKRMKHFIMALCMALVGQGAMAQVKIGGNPAMAADTTAVLELVANGKGLLIPRLSQAQQAAIASPANGLIVFNTDNRSLEYYDQPSASWRQVARRGNPLAEPELDSLHWKTDTAAKRVFLRRGYAMADSIFYDYTARKFLFADDLRYTNYNGAVLPITDWAGKYYFKSTASRRPDALLTGPYSSLIAVTEADESTVAGRDYYGFSAVALSNNKTTKKLNRLTAGESYVLHGGNDSIQLLRGHENNIVHAGKGYVSSLTGNYTDIYIDDSAKTNMGNVRGSLISIVKNNSRAYKVNNMIGLQVSMVQVINDFLATEYGVSGSAYGLYLDGVDIASPGKNFAIRTNRGINVLADSTMVGSTSKPRALFEVAGREGVIIPAGQDFDRPVAPVVGTVRYNTTFKTMEHFDGTAWHGTLYFSATVDVPSISGGGGVTVSVPLPFIAVPPIEGAVAVSPAGSATMPTDFFIAWARVRSSLGNVEIRFENRSSLFSVNPAAATYYFSITY